MTHRLYDNEKILLELKPNASWGVVFYFLLARLWRYFTLTIFLWVVFFMNIRKTSHPFRFLSSLDHQYSSATVHHWLLGIVAVILIFLSLMIRQSIKSYEYTITNQRCILSYGFLVVNHRIVPLAQINDLNMYSTFFEKMFGFGSIYLDTITSGFARSRRSRSSNNTLRLEALSTSKCEEVMHLIGQEMNREKS